VNIRIRNLVLVALAVLIAPGAVSAEDPQQVPERPEKLEFGPLDFEVPRAEELRHELPGGVVVYVVPDRSLPLVNIVLNVRTGAFREPADKPGVAALTASLMRVGGTQSRTADEFDEQADFLAARVSARSGDTGSSGSLNVLTSALGDGLDLLFEMLREPRFDDTRLTVEKGKILEAMKQRNDDAGDIQAREWSWLMYGSDHFASRIATAAEIEAIERDDLVAFHRRTWGADGLVISVSGDVEPSEIVAELGRRLVGWSAEEKAPWPPAQPGFAPVAGLYHVEKEIPQGKVRVGHRSLQVEDWSDPDLYALSVMNDILGGGGFMSRIMRRVRTEEGLAYGAGSSFGLGTFWESTFRAGYASKNPTVAYALEIVLEEIAAIRQNEPSAEEMKVSKASFIDTFPRSFESAAQIAGTFARDEILGRPHDYWYDYRDRIEAVTAADVVRVAGEYLKPEELVMLVVGKWEEIEPGDADSEASMEQFNGGRVEHLPLRDPLTLEPLGDEPTP
jgi:predicted Zn-dependent peptidase